MTITTLDFVPTELARGRGGGGPAPTGPTGSELFNLRNVFIETMCLLFSSYSCGLGALSAERRRPRRFLVFNVLTLVLGAAFLVIESTEFAGMVGKGACVGQHLLGLARIGTRKQHPAVTQRTCATLTAIHLSVRPCGANGTGVPYPAQSRSIRRLPALLYGRHAMP